MEVASMSNVLILLGVIVVLYIGFKIAEKSIKLIIFLVLAAAAAALYFLTPLAGSF